jgi:DNA-binding transcriptional ArsR family regulator
MDTFSAIADPVRREILASLRARPLTAGQIAARFPISRPAVSRHLRVLWEARLVSVSETGRTRVYRLETGPLADVEEWLGRFRDIWPRRLDALETEVFRTRLERERAGADAEGHTSPFTDREQPA